ncbi:schlafen family member 13-like [Lepus europaeus]|uniref:schlafen family member 13-like n=1 Tax=Lepus europaeus TaxID=9983 RepID=UPI002B463662|nr:schlafen family member 13-like [Lepus europaeus]
MNMQEHNSSLVRDLSYSDLVINVGEVTLGEENRKKMQKTRKNEERERVAQAACALLNSGGGVILLEVANKDDHPVEPGLDLEASWRELIQSSDLHTFFETKQQGRCFSIFVKSWSREPFSEGSSIKPRICSLSSSLYCRSGTSVLPMTPTEAFRFLKTKKRAAECRPVNKGAVPRKILTAVCHNISESHHVSESDLAFHIFQRDGLEYGEILHLPESQLVEFKQFSTKNIEKYVKETIPKYISAFANGEGGYLFLGVEDKTKKVLGCVKENVNRDSLERVIATAISKLPIFHFCSPKDPVGYETKIQDVFLKGVLYSYVCAIRVKPFCCAVFAEAPISWMVKKEQVCRLTTEEWVEMTMDPDPLAELTKDFESQLSLSHGPPSCKPVYSRKGLEHKEDLQQHLFPVPLGHLQYTPESLWKELCSEHEGLEELLSKEMRPFSRGILILSRSWAVDLSLPAEQGVICDALLIAERSPPILHTILREQDVDGQHYCTNMALTLKQKLVNMGGYTEKVCVMTRVLCLRAKNHAEPLQRSGFPIDYPLSYSFADTLHMEAFLQSLVVVLLGFRSFLSDQLGCEILNLLTLQQYEIFSKNLCKSRELFVHGLPGSGKTIMAVKIMEKIRNMFHCEANRILYICENKPLQDFISKKNICQAVTRKAFMKEDFENIQHIIIDEAQNFRTENGDWYNKAKAITQREKDHPGILWIFLDYFQTSHLDCSGLPLLSAQYPREELTRVVRNADDIAYYLRDRIHEIRRKPPPNIPSKYLEILPEAEWVRGVQGTLKIKKDLTRDQVVTYVADTCRLLFERGYSPRDVAVLVSTQSEVECYEYKLLIAMRKKRIVQLSNAYDISGDHIVLDSVRRFSGLERNVVFGIHPKTVDPAILPNLLACLASRAKKKLYILWLGDC